MGTKKGYVSIIDGAGGAASQRFIREEILSRFSNPALDPLEDSSWVTLDSNTLIVTADSFTVDPPVFPGGNIGHLAVSGIINDILASGGYPRHITLTLVITEGFPISTLQLVLDSVASVSSSSKVTVVAGDTKVVGKGLWEGGICIHGTGIGVPINPQKSYSISSAQANDKVIVTGTLGDHGFAVLSHREGLGFEQRVKSDCTPLDSLLIPILQRYESIRALRDPTRGGLLNALIDIAEGSQVNVLIDRDRVPTQREVDFGCEMLGISPLRLVNEGKMIIVAGEDEAGQIVSDCRKHPDGINAAIIGELAPKMSANGQLILLENGTKRAITRPEGIEIPQLC